MAETATCILIVEKDPVIRHAVAAYLRECGYAVVEALDSDEAITVMNAPDIGIDVVLSEVDCAGAIDGFRMAHWLRQNHPDTRIILAGSAERAAQKAADLCEDGPLLSKPYDHRLLLERIKWLMAARDRNTDR